MAAKSSKAATNSTETHPDNCHEKRLKRSADFDSIINRIKSSLPDLPDISNVGNAVPQPVTEVLKSSEPPKRFCQRQQC